MGDAFARPQEPFCAAGGRPQAGKRSRLREFEVGRRRATSAESLRARRLDEIGPIIDNPVSQAQFARKGRAAAWQARRFTR